MNGLRKYCTANHSIWYEYGLVGPGMLCIYLGTYTVQYQTQVRITCEIRLEHHLRARIPGLSFQGFSV